MTSQMICLLFYFFFILSHSQYQTLFYPKCIFHTLISECIWFPPSSNRKPAAHLSSIDTSPLVNYEKIKHNATDSRYFSVSSRSPHLPTFFLIRSPQSICSIETHAARSHLLCPVIFLVPSVSSLLQSGSLSFTSSFDFFQ